MWRTLGHLCFMVVLGGDVVGMVIVVGIFLLMTLKEEELTVISVYIVRAIEETDRSDDTIASW